MSLRAAAGNGDEGLSPCREHYIFLAYYPRVLLAIFLLLVSALLSHRRHPFVLSQPAVRRVPDRDVVVFVLVLYPPHRPTDAKLHKSGRKRRRTRTCRERVLVMSESASLDILLRKREREGTCASAVFHYTTRVVSAGVLRSAKSGGRSHSGNFTSALIIPRSLPFRFPCDSLASSPGRRTLRCAPVFLIVGVHKLHLTPITYSFTFSFSPVPFYFFLFFCIRNVYSSLTINDRGDYDNFGAAIFEDGIMTKVLR